MVKQRVAVITGANQGIGLGIAVQLASEGYALAIIGRSSEQKVKGNLDLIRAYQQPVFYYSGDLASVSEREQFCQELMGEYGRIDVLVNNAGVAPKERRDILEMTEESFDYVMNINLKGTLFLTQRIANIMIEEIRNNVQDEVEKNYSIVNITSISSYTSSPSRGEYCISKAGLSMVTKLFADRLAEFGINVYEIRPGITYTDMTRAVRDKYDRLIAEGLTPIQRWGQPEDVARAVSILCSGKLNFSTGEIINVDGGFHLRRL